MKLLVATTGAFSLMSNEGIHVDMNGGAVVEPSHWVQIQLGRGQIKVLGQLQDSATHEEWLNYLRESEQDRDLAAASFLSSFGEDQVSPADIQPESPPKPRSKPQGKKGE